jgi:hypothetical protein
LYEEESHKTIHNALMVATSNEMPNFISDSGTKRRMKGYEHSSKFLTKETAKKDNVKFDEKNHIYEADVNLNETIKNSNNLKNAIFDIYANYCYEWLEGEEIDLSKSQNFRDTTSLIAESNDFIQDFIDKKIIITNNESDRIGKEMMRDLFKETYPNKHLNDLQILSSLKDKKIQYKKDLRANNVRGCYVGVRVRDDDDENDIENGIDNKDLSVNQSSFDDISKEMKLLEEKLAKLNKLRMEKMDEIMSKPIKNNKKNEKNNKKSIKDDSDSESDDDEFDKKNDKKNNKKNEKNNKKSIKDDSDSESDDDEFDKKNDKKNNKKNEKNNKKSKKYDSDSESDDEEFDKYVSKKEMDAEEVDEFDRCFKKRKC